MSENRHLQDVASAGSRGKPEPMHDPIQAPDGRTSRSRAGALWAGLIVAALVLIVLLIFIVQNGNPVEIYFLTWLISLPAGVALLGAAVAGILVVAIPGASRMTQLRRAARRPR
jgi:uncharacterized integral membrane protein